MITREEHAEIFTVFGLKMLGIEVSQEILDNHWYLLKDYASIYTGEIFKKSLYDGWKDFGQDYYNHQQARKN